jgi:hypothetical protein
VKDAAMDEAAVLERTVDVHLAAIQGFYEEASELSPYLAIYPALRHDIRPKVLPFCWRSYQERDIMLALARALLKEVRAAAYLIATESWMAPYGAAMPDADDPAYRSPSQHPDRVEILNIFAVARSGRKAVRMLEIKRGEAGSVLKLSPLEEGYDFDGDLLELFGAAP